MNSLDFDTSGLRKRYLLGTALLLLMGVVYVTSWSLAATEARRNFKDLRAAEKALEAPRIRFLEASPQFNRPFKLAADRDFINTGPIWSASPALSYLDKKGISTQKLAEKYETLWQLLEQLQLQRDFSFEERALRMFLTASSKEVTTAMGENNYLLNNEEEFSRYQFLSEQGLAWYLQHYYVDPAISLSETSRHGAARRLIFDALRRINFRPISLSRYLRIPEYDRVMLFAAIFSSPDVLIGRSETVALLSKIVFDDFLETDRFELESHQFSADLVPLQKHFLGIYALREENFPAALKYFAESSEGARPSYHRDLATYMIVRTKFWGTHKNLVKGKKTMSKTQAVSFSHDLEGLSQLIRATNLRANIREYISLIKNDFTDRSRLIAIPKKKTVEVDLDALEKAAPRQVQVPAISAFVPPYEKP